jgi:hypothetical protein
MSILLAPIDCASIGGKALGVSMLNHIKTMFRFTKPQLGRIALGWGFVLGC